MAQSSRRRRRLTATSSIILALAAAAPARAGGYVGDLPIPSDDNSGATVWTGSNVYSTVSNPAGASILNEGAASGAVVANGGVIRNAPGATWNGDVAAGANVPGADIVNQGQWNGALVNAGGDIDNSGVATSANNASGVFANEGALSHGLVNGGQAANNGEIAGGVVNSGMFVNNAAGAVSGGLADTGSTTNNGAISGGVAESGAFVNNASGAVQGGFTLLGGSLVNNGEIAGSVTADAGAIVDNGRIDGGARIAGAKALLTVNGVLAGGAQVSAGSLIVNSAGVVHGYIANAGSLDNAGAITGGVGNSGAFVNQGSVALSVNQTAGQTTNDGTIAGNLIVRGGGAVNNGAVGGGLTVGATALVVDNGAVAGETVNKGELTVNAAGVLKGALVNSGVATVDGVLEGGALNSGALTVNAGGRVDGGLSTTGGATVNAGIIEGGATVTAGKLTSTGEIDGGLVDAGLVTARGTLSGAIGITGALVVGDVSADGARLTLAPGSSVSGALTMPVDFSTGQSNFLSAKGVSLGSAQLALSGNFASGAYWGAVSFSDTPIALTPAAQQQLAAASGPLYRYSDPTGTGIVQTINPGLGVSASAVAIAAATAFAEIPAPEEPPVAKPGLSVRARGFGADLAQSSENAAATGPAFDATKLSTRMAGGEIALEYGAPDFQISGLSFDAGLAGGVARAVVVDEAGSGASGTVDLPFVGAYAALSGLGFTGRVEARYLRLDMSLNDAPLAVSAQGARASGESYDAELSYRIPLAALFVEPTARVSYTRLAVASEATDVGELAFGAPRIALGQVGVKVGGDFSAGALAWRPYVLGYVGREWLSGAEVAIPEGPTFAPVGLSGFEQVGLGVSASLAHSGLTGFAEGAWTFGRIAGLTATGGLKFNF